MNPAECEQIVGQTELEQLLLIRHSAHVRTTSLLWNDERRYYQFTRRL